ncbi:MULTISPECIES: hypothetical protein [Streptococcus]|uniref:Uncharacterized protein n=1 Tax=Streptococcus caledonicus TaxID=2614158 RepID=A0ABW0U9S9_9STRE|nr:hypothetical protein [Streptococcus sp. S784/96/1]
MTDLEKMSFKYELDNLIYWESHEDYTVRKNSHYADFYEEYKREREEAERRRVEINKQELEEVSEVASDGSNDPLDVENVQDDVIYQHEPKNGSNRLSDDELLARLDIIESEALDSKIATGLDIEFGS